MKCHYEILNVPRSCTEEEIKKAYRKLALKWHPDKNLDNPEEAKQEFQVIQQAYDCLSDSHERAWYDRHRESIIRGGSRGEQKDEGLDIFPYFSCSCFKGFGEDDKGFFAVYRKLFTDLAEEETAYLDPDDLGNIPDFGFRDSDYKSVVDLFYSYWSSFCTSKSYGWEDKYDIREAPNRRVLRLMEKDNKKARDKAKKIRNEQVRELVSFIRRRDPRVLAHKKLLEEKAAKNALKTKEFQKRQLEERRQLVSSATEQEWSKMANLESGLQEMEQELVQQFGEALSEDSDNEVVGDDPLFCVACEKRFRSDKAFANHQNSKKHRESMAYLRDSLLEEEKIFHPELFEVAQTSEEIETKERKSKSKKKKKRHNQLNSLGETNTEAQITNAEELVIQENSEDCDDSVIKTAQSNHSDDSSLQSTKLTETEDSSLPCSTVRDTTATPDLGPNSDSDDLENVCDLLEAMTNHKSNGLLVEECSVEKPAVKLKGKKAKDARRKAKEDDRRKENDSVKSNTNCVVCHEHFASKNKLFDHLKKTGHAVYVPQTSGIKKGIKK